MLVKNILLKLNSIFFVNIKRIFVCVLRKSCMSWETHPVEGMNRRLIEVLPADSRWLSLHDHTSPLVDVDTPDKYFEPCKNVINVCLVGIEKVPVTRKSLE